jgi:hypothetical protein
MRFSKKALVATGTGAVLAMAIGGLALAYWTTSGNGSGTATAGTSSAFAVTVDSVNLSNLSPGGPIDTLNFHVKNNNTGVQNLSAVAAAVANTDNSPWTSGTCSAADFLVGTPAFTAGDIASGATVDGTVTIQMIDTGFNQDNCKSVSVPLYVAAS